MRAHILPSFIAGLILATISVGAHSNVGPSLAIDRTHKGDRLPVSELSLKPHQAPAQLAFGAHDLPEGCDALVSSLTGSQLARIAGRCES